MLNFTPDPSLPVLGSELIYWNNPLHFKSHRHCAVHMMSLCVYSFIYYW